MYEGFSHRPMIPPDSVLFGEPLPGVNNNRYGSNNNGDPTRRIRHGREIRTISVLVILLVTIIGVTQLARRIQNTRVGASYSLKRALVGTVESVNLDTNTFFVRYKESQDEKIAKSGYFIWTVKLAPGDFFAKTGSKFCFTVKSFTASFDQAKKVECKELIFVGKTVAVEYAILSVEKGEIIAKAVIGEE